MDLTVERLGLLDDAAIDLADAALACSGADRPLDDLAPVRARVAGLAARLLANASGVRTSAARGRLLAALLSGREGLSGDTEDYDNPDNADLARVFERGRGLPVTLSLLYAALARRVGWRADVLNVPGHVIIAIGSEGDRVLLDPYDGGRQIDARGLATIVARVAGRNAVPLAEHLEAMSNRDVLVRLQSNIAARARRAGDIPRALEVTVRMTDIAPRLTGMWWERARLEQQLGFVSAARASLAAMLETTTDRKIRGRIASAMASLARSNS